MITKKSNQEKIKKLENKKTISYMSKIKSILYESENRNKLYFYLLIIILICSLSGLYYFYSQTKSLRSPGIKAQEETKDLVAEIGKFMVLPTDETPTLATVSDPTKLQDQTFFAHAQTGDKVLIYSRNKKAILYNPTLHKIVEVAPVSINTGAQ